MEKIKVENAKEVLERNEKKQKTINYNKDVIDILALKRLKILDENNNSLLISSLWQKSSVILIFIRHFSCIACRAHVDMIWNKREAIKKNKTRIVFIGNGSPHFIKSFKEDMNVQDAEIYTDPSLAVFDACRMNRSIFNLLDPRSGLKALKLAKAGYSQGPIDKKSGTHRQMGGVVAMKPPGRVVYHFVSTYLGDFDDADQWPEEKEELPPK